MKRRMKIPTLVNMEWQYEHKATLIAILIEQLDTRLRSRAEHAPQELSGLRRIATPPYPASIGYDAVGCCVRIRHPNMPLLQKVPFPSQITKRNLVFLPIARGLVFATFMTNHAGVAGAAVR
jgi:hypothetical protein